MDEIELLRDYARTGSEAAFRAIVDRHLPWIYGIVLRQVGGDTHLAQDVTQGVFIALARKAGSIDGEDALAGWLFRAAGYAAKGAMRMRRRRAYHEAEAGRMSVESRDAAGSSDDTVARLDALGPLVEDAVANLRERDRRAVLLRFYQQKSHRQVGEALGLSEEAAKKRVARAVEKLRVTLARRGAAFDGAALAVGMGHLTQVVPLGLADGVVAGVFAGAKGAAVSTATAAAVATEVAKMMAWAKAKLVAAGTAAAVGVGGVVVVASVKFAPDRPARPGSPQATRVAPAAKVSTAPVEKDPPIVEAARACDADKVKRLLAAGADPNARGSFLSSAPLHEVVRWSWPTDKEAAGVAIAEALLAAGADPVALDAGGEAPIEISGSKSDRVVGVIANRIQELTDEARANPERAGPPPPLVPPGRLSADVATRGDLRVIALRLARGAHPGGADEHGQPLLHSAITFDSRELIDALLKSGAALTLRDRINGHTPLHVAVESQRHEIAERLLAQGADPLLADGLGRSAVYLESLMPEPKLFDARVLKLQAEDSDRWGEPVDGVQARLRRERAEWPAGKTPRLRLDVWNHWNRQLSLHADAGAIELLVDGVPYRRGNDLGKPTEFGPQAWVTDVVLELDDKWKSVADQKPLTLHPRKHRVLARVTAKARDGKEDLVIETKQRNVVVTARDSHSSP